MKLIYTIERVVDLGSHVIAIFSELDDAIEAMETIAKSNPNDELEIVEYPVLSTNKNFSERTVYKGDLKLCYNKTHNHEGIVCCMVSLQPFQ